MLQRFNPKNEDILVWAGSSLVPRQEAKVSVFDSVVQGGDAVWEGIRVYEEGVFLLEEHLNRLRESAHALAFENIPELSEIRAALFETLRANGMFDKAHVRLTLTRGEKVTSGMDPRLNQSGCTLIVLAEWKESVYTNDGISVISSSIRRNSPQFLDSKIHHNNLLNNILAKIQANVAGVDAGLMLDEHGFVSELNDTNVFLFKHGQMFTPFAKNCLPGITRGLCLKLARELGIESHEADLSLTDFYTADMAFSSGTMGELTPISEIDGRALSTEHALFDQIRKSFEEERQRSCSPIPR
jgi:branched-chain amino acid aminotransferase